MGKPQHVGTSADELREATREANAAMKDLQAATREAREAMRTLEAMVNDFNASVSEMLQEHRVHISADMGEIAADSVRLISQAIDRRVGALVAATQAKMRAQGIPEGSGTVARLRDVLGDVDITPTDETIDGLPSGVDMQINSKSIVQGMPVVTTGMVLSDLSEWPKPGPDDVKRKCGTCDRTCWLTPVRIAAAKRGASILCVVCTSMLFKLIRESGTGATVQTSKGGSMVYNGSVSLADMLKAAERLGGGRQMNLDFINLNPNRKEVPRIE